MAPHTPGSGASVSGVSYADPEGAASLERYVYGILALLEQKENQLPRISERTDKITITANLSTKIAAIELILNVIPSIAAGGAHYEVTDYLTGATFASGTGGSSSAPNLAQAAMEAVISLKLRELDPTKNIQKQTVVTQCMHTLAASGGTNATFNARLEFPIEIISLPGGGNVIEGKTYLS